MFALIAVVVAALGLFMALTGNVAVWVLWVWALCVALHLLLGNWPFGAISINRRPGS